MFNFSLWESEVFQIKTMKQKHKILTFLIIALLPQMVVAHGGAEHLHGDAESGEISHEDVMGELAKVEAVKRLKDLPVEPGSQQSAIKEFLVAAHSNEKEVVWGLLTPKKRSFHEYYKGSFDSWLKLWQDCIPLEIGEKYDEGKSELGKYKQESYHIQAICGDKERKLGITLGEIMKNWYIDDMDYE